jgi:hypothetical protein
MHSVLITSYELICRRGQILMMGSKMVSETLVMFNSMTWMTAQDDFANYTTVGFEVLTVLNMKRDVTLCSLIILDISEDCQ